MFWCSNVKGHRPLEVRKLTVTRYEFRFHGSFLKLLPSLFLVILIMAALISYLTNLVSATAGRKGLVIPVRRGDTLWSIASSLAPDSDPRPVIQELKEENHLRGSDLAVGQRLIFK